MPATYLNSSTFSEAVSADANTFTVASTANITVGALLVARSEVMRVQAIPVSGRVVARRGVEGTVSLAHASSAKFWIGTPEKFKAIKDAATAVVGDNGTLPDFLLPGRRAIDYQGNEYVMLDLTTTLVKGATVLISRDGNYTASVISSASEGSVAILAEGGTSDQWVWGQIRGFNDHAKMVGGSSLATSLGEFQGATSVSTPSVGLLGRSSSQRSTDEQGFALIYGMYPAGAATTASTSASSETGFYAPAYLQYPFIRRTVTS